MSDIFNGICRGCTKDFDFNYCNNYCESLEVRESHVKGIIIIEKVK